MSKPAVTMGDVAVRAGVSQATVSFVLGGRAERQKISQETRDRVTKAANELSYQRNQLARAMVTGNSRTIGLLTSDRSVDNITAVMAGAMDVASQNDYMIKVVHLAYDEVDDATIARCLEWRLAGALIVGFSAEAHLRLNDAFENGKIPVSLVDNVPQLSWGVRIGSDDRQGIGQAVSHLVALGHSRIAFLGGRTGFISEWRKACFREALVEAGLSCPQHWVRESSWGDPVIMETQARTLLADNDGTRPTAVVCSADEIAMVVARVARSLGIRVPEDLSVTGYSNATLSPFSDPALTTVDQSFYQMGRVATLQIIHFAEKGKYDGEVGSGSILLPTRLIPRSSTAPPAPG